MCGKQVTKTHRTNPIRTKAGTWPVRYTEVEWVSNNSNIKGSTSLGTEAVCKGEMLDEANFEISTAISDCESQLGHSMRENVQYKTGPN